MNAFAAIVLAVCALGILAVSRQWAALPLLAGTTYLGFAPGIDLGDFSFQMLRIIVLVGLTRILLRGERLPGGIITMDKLMLTLAIWCCISAYFHNDPKSDLTSKLGEMYDICGTYLLLRIFVPSQRALPRLAWIMVLIFMPIAVGMALEVVGNYNVFSLLGAAPEVPMMRNGKPRAFGPFVHPILAGTVGAVTLPFFLGLWYQRKVIAVVGATSALMIVFASGSSGPMLSLMAGLFGFALWQFRQHLSAFRWMAVAAYGVLSVVMTEPAYYIIARFDVTGGSTGWHRAALIESSIRYFSEWWLTGTDYTRHWMPTGVSWSPNHTDITNYYLHHGVIGGMPQMLLFIAVMGTGFVYVGRYIKQRSRSFRDRFLAWALGACLFAQAATCVSVSYFDQSLVYLYLTFAAIGSSLGARQAASERSTQKVRTFGDSASHEVSSPSAGAQDSAATDAEVVWFGSPKPGLTSNAG